MARLFKLELELYPSNETRPNLCVEAYETVRLANRHRVLHFGIAEPLNEEDADWVTDVVRQEILSLFHRTVGIHAALDL